MSDDDDNGTSLENPLFPPSPGSTGLLNVGKEYGYAVLRAKPTPSASKPFRPRYPGESDSEYRGDWVIFVFQQNYRAMLLAIACFICVLALLLSTDVARAKVSHAERVKDQITVACGTAVARRALCAAVVDDCETTTVISCADNSTARVVDPSDCDDSACTAPCDWLAIYNSSSPLVQSPRSTHIGMNLYAPIRNATLRRAPITARWLMKRAESFLEAAREEECCCAPMFGARVIHITVRNDTQSTAQQYLHMFGVVDSLWSAYDTLSTDTRSYDIELLGALSVVEHHNAAALFDLRRIAAHNGTVKVVRRDVLHLTIVARRGVHRRVTLTGQVAYCVALCYDLLAGISVFERAVRQRSLAIAQVPTLSVERAVRQIKGTDSDV